MQLTVGRCDGAKHTRKQSQLLSVNQAHHAQEAHFCAALRMRVAKLLVQVDANRIDATRLAASTRYLGASRARTRNHATAGPNARTVMVLGRFVTSMAPRKSKKEKPKWCLSCEKKPCPAVSRKTRIGVIDYYAPSSHLPQQVGNLGLHHGRYSPAYDGARYADCCAFYWVIPSSTYDSNSGLLEKILGPNCC